MTAVLIVFAIAACVAIVYQMAAKRPQIVPLDPQPEAVSVVIPDNDPEETEEKNLQPWQQILSSALKHIYSGESISPEERHTPAYGEPSEVARVAMGDMIDSFQKISTLHSSLAHLNDPTFSMKKVAEAVTRDPVLSSHVLKAVNGAAFGLAQGVRSIHTAVNILGVANLKSILVFQTMPHTLYATAEQRIMFREVWRHMNITAIIASFIARTLHDLDGGALYTAGLMHDIGKLVLVPLSGDGTKTYPVSLAHEYDLFSATHLQAAKIMAARENNAPGQLWDLILGHHLPALTPLSHLPFPAETSRALTVLFLANQLAKLVTAKGELEESRMDHLDRFDPGYAEIISREDMKRILFSQGLMQDILGSVRLVQAMLN